MPGVERKGRIGSDCLMGMVFPFGVIVMKMSWDRTEAIVHKIVAVLGAAEPHTLKWLMVHFKLYETYL